MKGTVKAAGVVLALALVGATPDPVEAQYVVGPYTFYSFGGHYYALSLDRMSWTDAHNTAAALPSAFSEITRAYVVSLEGREELGGDDESAFLLSTFGSGLDYFWIGLAQSAGAATPGSGWGWDSGESFFYSNWADGEPNDGDGTEDGGEDYAHMYGGTFGGFTPGTWNDQGDDAAGHTGGAGMFAVYEAELALPPATVPEPASLALLLTGVLGLAVVARRREG